MTLTRLAILLVALVVTAGCDSGKQKLSADAYYKDASDAYTKRNYDVAAMHYKELLDQYPFSEHAEEAELRIATAQYKSKHYAEAIAALNDFQRMHPMSPNLPEVYYLLGKSYMDQMTTTDRDQTAAENGHGWFRVVIERYPTSPYAIKSQRKLMKCRFALAEHELHIAEFYFKHGNLKAGENRVKDILENYPDTPAATRGIEALAAAYARVGDHEHEHMAQAALAERPGAEAIESKVADDAKAEKQKDKSKDKGGAPETTIASLPAPSIGGPASALLLADLTARYGHSQGVSTAATSPSLIDPVKAKSTLLNDRAGPSANAPGPLGGY
jgi:outer membrane protein assembly factor BamD